MAVLPEEIPTGTLKGQFYFVNEDNIDADTKPELTVVKGFVRCVASVKTLRMASKKAIVIPLRFDAKFDGQGNLVPENGNGIGMEMPAVDSPLFDTTGWTWTATFELVEAETGFTVNLAPVPFQIFEGKVTDLSDLVPVEPSQGVITTRGEPGPVGLPGKDGQDGLDGSNVLPTNDAVAQAIETEGPTKTALSAAIALAVSDVTIDPATLDAAIVNKIAEDGTVVAAAATAVDGVLAGAAPISSGGIARIVAAEVGTTPVLNDGDMVVYYDRPGKMYYTDFSEYATDTFPAGWSMPWQADRPWKVLTVPDATGGKALTIDSPVGNNLRAALICDAISSDPARADVEILFRTRSVGASSVLTQALGRASGGDTTETGYRMGSHSTTTVSASKFINGQWLSSTNHTMPAVEADVWYLCRARINGATQRVKVWKDGEVEPAWQREATDTTITAPGLVGLLAQGMPNLHHIDWVAFATGGRTAAPL